jgi:hypothetical protein
MFQNSIELLGQLFAAFWPVLCFAKASSDNRRKLPRPSCDPIVEHYAFASVRATTTRSAANWSQRAVHEVITQGSGARLRARPAPLLVVMYPPRRRGSSRSRAAELHAQSAANYGRTYPFITSWDRTGREEPRLLGGLMTTNILLATGLTSRYVSAAPICPTPQRHGCSICGPPGSKCSGMSRGHRWAPGGPSCPRGVGSATAFIET